MSVACSPEAPPKASSANRRGRRHGEPRRAAPSAIFVLTIRWIPRAALIRSISRATAISSHRRLGGRAIEPAPPAEKNGWVEIAEHQDSASVTVAALPPLP